MVTRVKRMALVETPESAPRYELRVRGHRPGDTEYEIWQMPSAATPQITSATRIAGLRGRNLELVEYRVLKRLGGAGVKLGPSRRRERHGYALTEDLALTLGLLGCSRPCAAAATCGRWLKASRPWAARRRPTGSAWRCTASTPAGCSRRSGAC